MDGTVEDKPKAGSPQAPIPPRITKSSTSACPACIERAQKTEAAKQKREAKKQAMAVEAPPDTAQIRARAIQLFSNQLKAAMRKFKSTCPVHDAHQAAEEFLSRLQQDSAGARV